jgi:hypothetical protein
VNPKDTVGAKKAPTRYVPQALVLEAAAVMATGAAKYGPFNWREQPVSAVTYAEAIQRHLAAWVEGQDNAEDSGLNHIAHIAASCGILLDAAANGTLLDDRVAGPAAAILRRLDRSGVSPAAPVGAASPTFTAVSGGELGAHFEVERGPGGWYPCCGATEHTLDCPQWR